MKQNFEERFNDLVQQIRPGDGGINRLTDDKGHLSENAKKSMQKFGAELADIIADADRGFSFAMMGLHFVSFLTNQKPVVKSDGFPNLDEIDALSLKWEDMQSKAHLVEKVYVRKSSVREIADGFSIEVPAILIRINQMYREGMSAEELFEVTRGVWKVGEKREIPKYAFAVYKGVIKEVYRIDRWLPAGTLEYKHRPDAAHMKERSDRWEFDGRLAEKDLREWFIGKSCERYLKRGNISPIIYVNCDEDDTGPLESKDLTLYKAHQMLICIASSAQIYYEMLWEIWRGSFQNFDKTVEFFLKIAEKKKIVHFDYQGTSEGAFLSFVFGLKKGDCKRQVRVAVESPSAGIAEFLLKQFARDWLELQIDNELVQIQHEDKIGFWANADFVFDGSNIDVTRRDETMQPIADYDLACVSCAKGTGNLSPKFRQDLINSRLQWVISSFPHELICAEDYWRLQRNRPQWLFFCKDYAGSRISFFNMTAWDISSEYHDGLGFFLFGLLEKWDFLPKKWDSEDFDFYSDCDNFGYYSVKDLDVRKFCDELRQGRLSDQILLQRLGGSFAALSVEQLDAVLKDVIKDPEFASQVIPYLDPNFLSENWKESIESLQRNGSASLSPRVIERLNSACLTYLYPAGIFSNDFRWRYLFVPKDIVLEWEAVLNQPFWQSEINRGELRHRSAKSNEPARNIIGDVARAFLLPEMQKLPYQNKGLLIIDRSTLRDDGWGIDFEKGMRFVEANNVPSNRIISKPVVLGFLGHRGFPVWFEYFDPQQSPYKQICLSEKIIILEPLDNVSVISLWDALIECLYHSHNFHGNVNWWVFKELSNVDEWFRELCAIDDICSAVNLERDPLFSEENARFIAHFENQVGNLSNFFKDFRPQSTINSTFDSFVKFLYDFIGKSEVNAARGETKTILFRMEKDSDSLKPFDSRNIEDGLKYKIDENGRVAILVWGKGTPCGVLEVISQDWAKNTAEVDLIAHLSSFVCEMFLNSQDATEKYLTRELAHTLKNKAWAVQSLLEPIRTYINDDKNRDGYIFNKKQLEALEKSKDGVVREDFLLSTSLNKAFDILGIIAKKAKEMESVEKLGAFGKIEEIVFDDILKFIQTRSPEVVIDGNLELLRGISVAADKKSLWKALDNLIDNAIAYSPDKNCRVDFILGEEYARIYMKNKNEDITDDLLQLLGQRPVESKRGGSGFYYSKYLIEHVAGGALRHEYNNEMKEFSVWVEFKYWRNK